MIEQAAPDVLPPAQKVEITAFAVEAGAIVVVRARIPKAEKTSGLRPATPTAHGAPTSG